MPEGGIASVEARVNDIRVRFEPPPPANPATSPGAGTDFAEVMGLFEEAGLQRGMPLGMTAYSSPILGGRTQLAAPLGRGGDVVQASMQYLGVPYLWGGTNPDQGLDCSGFVQRVHRDLGIELPRVSTDQARGGQPVASLAEARPGDVLAFGQPVNHVAIYLGNGQMVHAPRRGDVVKIEAIDRPITAIRRYTTAAPPWGTAVTGAPHTTGFGGGGVTSVPYANLFNLAGVRHGVDPRLLAAVAQVESGFNPTAVSRAGAQGLMQFMPGTAAGLGIDPLDPAQAIDGAARYLRSQLDTFGSVELALAAYNAGPGAVSRHGGIPPFAETQAYVPKVLAAMNGVR
jgi:peptidoglycan DL-endopeptidase CwlO